MKKGAADVGITYPVALDNSYSTWTNYRNRYWPAEYLIDADGHRAAYQIRRGRLRRHRKLIRELLTTARPGVSLPPPVDAPDTTPKLDLTRETYFGVGKAFRPTPETVYTTRGAPRPRIRRHCPPTPLPYRDRGHWTTRARPPTAIPRISN